MVKSDFQLNLKVVISK